VGEIFEHEKVALNSHAKKKKHAGGFFFFFFLINLELDGAFSMPICPDTGPSRKSFLHDQFCSA
jgi:hypothetical protein